MPKEKFISKEDVAAIACEVEESAADPLKPEPYILSTDTLNSLQELGEVLRGIHKRMAAEGYELVEGAISKKL